MVVVAVDWSVKVPLPVVDAGTGEMKSMSLEFAFRDETLFPVPEPAGRGKMPLHHVDELFTHMGGRESDSAMGGDGRGR